MTNDQRRKIIVADDEKIMRRFVGVVIEQKFPEFEVEFFEDGSSLESRLNQGVENIRLVITDNTMPGVKGSELIKKYATREEFRRIHFILYYGGDESIGEQAIRNGAFRYLLKPSPLTEFSEAVGQALRLSDYQI